MSRCILVFIFKSVVILYIFMFMFVVHWMQYQTLLRVDPTSAVDRWVRTGRVMAVVCHPGSTDLGAMMTENWVRGVEARVLVIQQTYRFMHHQYNIRHRVLHSGSTYCTTDYVPLGLWPCPILELELLVWLSKDGWWLGVELRVLWVWPANKYIQIETSGEGKQMATLKNHINLI